MRLMNRKSSHLMNKINLVASKNQSCKISEEYRTIRTNFLTSMNGRKTQSLIITSPNHKEGKSTTAANFAISLTQLGKKVLLIDADLRNSVLYSSFKINNCIGLSSVLNGEIKLEDAINKTEITGLDLLSSGPIPLNPADLLGSKLMGTLIDTAIGIYDVVLIDTPPVLEVADVKIISNYCDGIILVIHLGKTERDEVIQVKKRLADSSKLVGVILNDKM